MNPTLLFVATVVFSFVIGRSLARWASHWSLPTGISYIAAGILLGPVVPPAVLSDEVLRAFELLLSMVLGILGFSVGLSMRRKRRDLETTLAGVLSSACVAIGITAISLLALQISDSRWLNLQAPIVSRPLFVVYDQLVSLWIIPDALWLSLSLGAVASVSSVVVLWQLSQQRQIRANTRRLVSSLSSSTKLTAILIFGVAMAGSRATSLSSQLPLTLTEWAILSIFAGSVCGLLFGIFIGKEDDDVRINVAIVGAVIFASGAGAALGVSPLLVNLIAGLVVSSTSTQAERLESMIERLRNPANVMVFLLTGAYWRPVDGWMWLFVLGYVVVRTILRLFFTRVSVSTFLSESAVANGVGQALLTQGTLACAIALAYTQRFPEHRALVLSTVIGGVVLSDILSVTTLRRYLADVGALDPVADDGPKAPPTASPPQASEH